MFENFNAFYILVVLMCVLSAIGCWFGRDAMRSRLGGTIGKHPNRFNLAFSKAMAYLFLSASMVCMYLEMFFPISGNWFENSIRFVLMLVEVAWFYGIKLTKSTQANELQKVLPTGVLKTNSVANDWYIEDIAKINETEHAFELSVLFDEGI